MDSRHRNIAGEIARLEAALRRERDALLKALDQGSRQALRRNLDVVHEELGALYRRLHALGATDDLIVGTPLYVVERGAGDDGPGGV
jgi:putative heme degradation protein